MAPSSSIAGKDDDKNSSHKRIALMLYRQLLRWCDETDKNIPLSQSIPPIHMSPPQINPDSLLALIESSGILKSTNASENDDGVKSKSVESSPYSSVFSPRTSSIEKSGITIHSVPTSAEAKEIVKAVFRMNASTIEEQDRKNQLSLAFEWIKTLNELTQQLEEMKTNRRNHQNREGVDFRVGQIVKHRTLSWRGVVLGWSRRTKSNETDAVGSEASSQATSLTQKSYDSINPDNSYADDDEIVYDIALDWGDATLLSSAKHPSGLKNVYQSDLMLVNDPDLMRVRSATDQFQRFDPELQCFVPGDALTYIYPNDRPIDELDNDRWTHYENPSDKSAEHISQGIKSFAEYLRQIIMGFTSAPESRNLRLLSGYLDRLTKLSNGDAIPAEDRYRSGLFKKRNDEIGKQEHDSVMTQTKMKWELQKLVELAVEIEDVLWTRRKALETDRSIKFSLGEYVRHKKYGFRGVVVGWDPGEFFFNEIDGYPISKFIH
jgi:heat shock protein HspQ